jgi:hypothetical protein
MRVIFFTDKLHDYLSESLFHGLRSILGNDCIDIDRYDQLYKDTFETVKHKLRGNGFSLYGLLEDNEELRNIRKVDYKKLIKPNDLIILNNILNQYPIFNYLKSIKHDKIAILDGADSPQFTFYQSIRKTIKLAPKALLSDLAPALYFKREYISEEIFLRNKAVSFIFKLKNKDFFKRLKPIAFSIPKEKINQVYEDYKTQKYPSHIVDQEIAGLLNFNKHEEYAFEKEKDYYDDLAKSKFGITTKRAGWDCLRHYELASNGAVLCFKNLNKKAIHCAPHGLIDGQNCISYNDYEDLQIQLNNLSEEKYHQLIIRNYEWISRQTTIERANEFLNHFS